MSRFLNEYEMVSSLTVPAGHKEIEVSHSAAHFTATISQLRDEGDTARLNLRIYLDADSTDDAYIKGQNFAGELREMLAIATSAKFERPVIKRIIDWTPGIQNRDVAVFTDGGQLSHPHPVLDANIATTVSLLLREGVPQHVRGALAWYRDGLLASGPDRKVHAFWLALETLVGGSKPTQKVADRCQTCKSPLYCPTCKKTSEHRPFPVQKIKLLMREVVNDDDVLFNEAVAARHTLMHGGTLVGGKDGNPFPYADMIDRLGAASRECATRELLKALPGGLQFTVLQPSTYNQKTFQFRSRTIVEVPLVDGQLLPESIPETKVELIRENGGFVVAHSTVANARVDIAGMDIGESNEGPEQG